MGEKGWFRAMFLCLLAFGFAAQPAFGSGFVLFEASTRGNSLGGAMVGRADDPSALFFNPAGITQLPGLQILGGTTAIMPTTDIVTHGARVETTSMVDNVWNIPHLYTTYQVSERVWLGLAFFSPFGLGTEFNEDWPGRFNSYNAVVQSLTMNPNMAFKLNEKLSLAAGFDVMWFDLTLEAKIPTGPANGLPAVGDIDRSIKADSFGYGFNLGARYQPFDWMALGLSYRSEVKQDLEGRIDFTKPAALQVDPFRNLFRDTGVSGSTVLPDMIFMGIVFYPTRQLSVELSSIWTHWSNFDELKFTLDTPVAPGQSPVSRTPKNWRDTWRFQLGIEHKTTSWLDLRTGYVFDQEAIPDEHIDYILPANDRHRFDFGSGFHWCNWTVDFSYSYLLIEDRDVAARPQEGIQDSEFRNGHAHLIGLSAGYKF